ncbi:hypothetical protein BGZ95_006676, partial [Linnemannia exigua]
LAYRMSCKGSVYNVDNTQSNTVKYEAGCTDFSIDFSGNNIFRGINKPRHFYYVARDNLFEMVSKSDFAPRNCNAVVG